MIKTSVDVGIISIAIQLLSMVIIHSGRVAMLGPFISSLQILIFSLLYFKINTDTQLLKFVSEIYAVASIDCIPEPILEWLQPIFGSFAPAGKVLIE